MGRPVRTTQRPVAKAKQAKPNTANRKQPEKKEPPVHGEAFARRRAGAMRDDYKFGMFLMIVFVIMLLVAVNPTDSSYLNTVHIWVEYAFGECAYLLLPVELWIAIRFMRNSKYNQRRAALYLVPIIIYLLVLTIVQTYHVAELQEITKAYGYFDFIKKTAGKRVGGGCIGSLAGYICEKTLGKNLTLIPGILLILYTLYMDGRINLASLAVKTGQTGAVVGKFVVDYTGKAVKKAVTMVENHKREPIYQEDFNLDDDSRPVSVPPLNKNRRGKAQTAVPQTGNNFVIPRLKRKVKDIFTGGAEEDFEEVDELFDPKRKPGDTISDRARRDSKTVRAERYVDHVPGTTRTVRPVRPDPAQPEGVKKSTSAPSGETRSRTAHSPFDMSKIPETPSPKTQSAVPPVKEEPAKAETPVAPKPHVPAQPKPSYFEGDVKNTEGKTVRQNTTQGEYADTVYVKPDGKAVAKREQETASVYTFPPFDLMEQGEKMVVSGNAESDRQRAEILIGTFKNFSIPVKLVGISHGPAVTRFEIQPAPGIKVSKLSSYADDIAMALSAVSVRIEAPIPGKNAVGVEVPNISKEIVHMRDVLQCEQMTRSGKKLMVGLGKDNSGKFVVADLAGMPHVLIAGQTGSGKSVCINAIIVSILYRASPEDVRLILVDPKMVELNVYNSIPHLLVPVVTDPKKAAGALEWAVGEMTRRYKVFADHGAKNIESYNLHLPEGEQKMPQIVIVIDELADLMMTSPRDVEEAINRLAQLARAAGMHLVIATQRPSVDVITGLIKANIPTRIAFTVSSGVDSRTILDAYGAERLLGKGDMLYLPSDRNKPMRLQGAWVSEDEVQAIVDYVSQGDKATFDEEMLKHMEEATLSDAEKDDKKKEEQNSEKDELFEEAVRCVVDAGQASISMLQRRFSVGYARAGRLIDEMAQRGFISQSLGSKSREVLITREELNRLFSEPSPAEDSSYKGE